MNKIGTIPAEKNPGMMALGGRKGFGVTRPGGRIRLLPETYLSGDDAEEQIALMKKHGIGPFETESLDFESLEVGFQNAAGNLTFLPASRLMSV